MQRNDLYFIDWRELGRIVIASMHGVLSAQRIGAQLRALEGAKATEADPSAAAPS